MNVKDKSLNVNDDQLLDKPADESIQNDSTNKYQINYFDLFVQKLVEYQKNNKRWGRILKASFIVY